MSFFNDEKYHAFELFMVLITSMLPLKLSHLAIMLDILLVPFLGRAFFWNTNLIPVFSYFFYVFIFYSIRRIFLLFVFYSWPKFNGPFYSYFSNFSSWIFCYNKCLSSLLILGFCYGFLMVLTFGVLAWILGTCWGVFLMATSMTSSSDYDSELSISFLFFWLLICFIIFSTIS